MLDSRAVHIADATAHRDADCDDLDAAYETCCIALEPGNEIPLRDEFDRCEACWHHG